MYLFVKTDHPESSAEAADYVTDSLAAHPKVSIGRTGNWVG